MKFSEHSLNILSTCHPDLQFLFKEVIKHYNCAVLCGFRNEADQNRAFIEGRSKKKWGESNHNKQPSLAVDVAPFPIDWNNKEAFYHFAGFVRGLTLSMGIKIISGADWDGDFDLKDQTFFDLPHFELLE